MVLEVIRWWWLASRLELALSLSLQGCKPPMVPALALCMCDSMPWQMGGCGVHQMPLGRLSGSWHLAKLLPCVHIGWTMYSSINLHVAPQCCGILLRFSGTTDC